MTGSLASAGARRIAVAAAVAAACLASSCTRRDRPRGAAPDAAPGTTAAAADAPAKPQDAATSDSSAGAQGKARRDAARGGGGHRASDCAPGNPPGPAPDFPDGLLLQSLHVAPDGRISGFRVREDARLQSHPLGRDWTTGAPLDSEKLARVRRAIAEKSLAGVTPAMRLPPPADDVGRSWLQVRDGDAVRTVMTDDPCFVPEVHALLVELAELLE